MIIKTDKVIGVVSSKIRGLTIFAFQVSVKQLNIRND